jgi:phytoene/squalene synthetase
MTEEVLRRAYRYCGWITTRHYENFPVASWLLPARMRPHVAAVYAFARSADDFADEQRYHGRSLELLDQWRSALWASVPPSPHSGAGFTRTPSSPDIEAPGSSVNARSPHPPSGAKASSVPGDHPIFLALADTVRQHDLPVQLLDDLLTAFTMDVTKRRYNDWPDLMNYCRHSANPVGRLVLLLSGIRDEELHARSDDICSGLQLANHWQDLSVDLARGILYIPQDLMRSFGVTEAELRSYSPCSGLGFTRTPSSPDIEALGSSVNARSPHPPSGAKAAPVSPVPGQKFRSLMKELVGRARVLFDSGEPLVKHLKGGLRLEIKLTLLGGRTILDRIEAADYDVFRHRPVISTPDKVGLLARALLS